MSHQSGDGFEESGVFQASLSMWKGSFHVDKDGLFSYEDANFDPIPLDLHTAASIGETDIVQDILDSKTSKVNSVNKGGWSSLMYAAYMGHEKTILLLLEMGADTNQKTRQGSTSLILAAMCGCGHVMPSLLQNGASLEAKDNRGWTALFHAASSGHQQTTEFLIKAGADCEVVEPTHHLTPVMEAAASGHTLIVQQFLNRGVDIRRKDINGDNARTLALEYGHLQVADLIDNFKPQRPKGKNQQQNVQKHKQSSHHTTNNYSSSGPSIHDGPKAFAQMTGLGADGKPKPNAVMPSYLQDHTPEQTSAPRAFESKWAGPKDLASVLEEINCLSSLHIFKEQDIDLRIFLTLSEAELKEIGIDLFGRRRKMVTAIARINSSIQASLIDKTELAYSDSIMLRTKEVESKLIDTQESVKELRAQLAQERQLRSVAESVLMEQKESKSAIHQCIDKLSSEHRRLLLLSEQLRSFFMHSNQSKHRHQINQNMMSKDCRMSEQDLLKFSQDYDTTLQRSRDYLLEMQRLLQIASSADPNRLASDQGMKMKQRR